MSHVLRNHPTVSALFLLWLGLWIVMVATWLYDSAGYTVGMPMPVFFIFLVANAIGSAVPTPGGLGGVEAALTFSFGAAGVPAGIALSATLLYRALFYWLRIPLGALRQPRAYSRRPARHGGHQPARRFGPPAHPHRSRHNRRSLWSRARH